MEPGLARHLELDRRMVAAVGGIRLLAALSWPAQMQQAFLRGWRSGRPELPQPTYPTADFADVRAELGRIHAHADAGHPLGQYLRRSTASYLLCTDLLDAVGSPRLSGYSARLFGKPGDSLPGSSYTNLDAARHFIDLAAEVDSDPLGAEPDYCLSAETMQKELQRTLDTFFVDHPIRVEIDPGLISKAAAGASRIRLRANTGFTEYDLRQLLEHEALIHSLTAINGREQPHLRSLGRTAPRVTATQEGLATFAELMTGSIDLPRLKRLSLRVIAIDMALSGADFIEVFRYFLESGQGEAESFSSAHRVFRGCRTTGGSAFTKDTVYLHGMLSVHTFFRWTMKHRRPRLIRLLFAGKMALHDVFTLEPLYEDGTIAEPLYLPPWVQRAGGLAGILAFSLFANRIRIDQVVAEDLVLGV